MKFEIRRTHVTYDSNGKSDAGDKPCPEAYKEAKAFNDEMLIWFVDIYSLEHLVNFSKRYGQLIFVCAKEQSIEIYDDYRE